ncbi:MAG TPA: DUF6603 domain-containing protein [Conexibacter sp.]|nr:DUF6603 domain-containing protein [Conexibacter sp.]
MSEKDLLRALLDEALRFAEPAFEAARSPSDLRRVFATAGWDLDAIAGLDVEALGRAVGEVIDVIEQLARLAGGGPLDFEAIFGLLSDVAEAAQAIDALAATFETPLALDEDDLAALGVDLLDYLLVTYLQRHHPLALQLLVMIALADPPELAGPPRLEAQPGRVATRRPRLALQRTADLIDDPVPLLRERWLPADENGRRGFESQRSADKLADLLLPNVANLARAVGADAVYGTKPLPGTDFGAFANERAKHALTVLARIPLPVGDQDARPLADSAALEASLRLGMTVLLSGRDGGAGLGVVVLPSGALQIGVDLARWRFELDVATGTDSGGVPLGFAFDGRGVTVPAGATPNVRASLGVTRLSAPGAPAIVLGSDSTRLQIGGVAMELGSTFSEARVAPWVQADLLDARIVVQPGDGDSFLKAVLPPGGLQVPFELGVRWAQGEGLTFRGGASLEVALPVGVDLGFLRIPVVNLSFGISGRGVALGLAATADLRLGPVAASIERMGVALVFAPPPAGRAGVAGPVDVGLKFLPPKGIGMSVDAGPVAGGGYIFLDPDAGEYAGVLHLEVGPVSVTAIGLLQTKLPGGVDGFSLVVLICASFPPIQLGYGFSLIGLGGLLGINRRMDVDALRDGVRSGALGSLLFPDDPVPRARQIIADVGAIFPPAQGQFVVGPMVKLGWGAPAIITATLAVVIQLPTFVIAILGRIQVALPEEGEAAVLLLRVDVVGIIDPGRGEISIDGSLTGSRVAVFAIDGDFALRMRFGPDPLFALSAGGFHPKFRPPPGVPALRRLSITLATGDNPRLRLEAYTAITPATFQFGARVQLYASADLGLAGFFELEAEIGFDVLILFSPFSLEAGLRAQVALRRNGALFAGVSLEATLKGPTPWEVEGRASVKVAFIEAKVRVHHTVGEAADAVVPPTVEIAVAVREALGDVGSWRTVLPALDPGVRLREVLPAEGELLAHPLGELEARQKLAPLGVRLEKVGESRVGGEDVVTLDALRLGQQTIRGYDGTSDMFAPGQYFAMSDEQKLTGPAFETMRSGGRAAVEAVAHWGAIPFEPGYEDRVVDAPDRPARLVRTAPLDAHVLRHALADGPAATAGVAARAQRFAGPSMGIAVEEPQWAVVATEAGVHDVVATFPTAAQARAASRGGTAVVEPVGAR